MNVLQYAEYNAPYEGNFIQSLKCLNDLLRSRGEQMYLMLEKREQPVRWQSDTEKDGLPVSYVDTHHLSAVKYLRRFILAHDIQAVHLHFADLLRLPIFCLAAAGTHAKLYLHLHNHLFPGKAWIKRILLRKFTLCCCSQSVADSAVALGIPQNRVYTVENAIDFKRLDRNNEDFLRTGLFDNDRYKLLLFGFDYERKGVDLVLDALDQIPGEKKIQLYISVSSRLEQVKKKISERFGAVPQWVTLLPPCNEIGTYYRSVDAFISASREEGFCYALIEAAYCGADVIASRIPAQQDLCLPNAIWFDSEDVAGLKEILEALPEREKSPQKIAEQKETVVLQYDLNQWAEKLHMIYHKR